MTSRSYKETLLGIGGDGGSTRQAITKKQLQDLLITIPPCLDEQKEIVHQLDQLSFETQRLETIYQQKLTALTELKQSLLQKAFTGELTANKVVAFPTAVSKRQDIETTSPEFSAHVLAFAYHWHESQRREKTFGHVKAQKILHMVESIAHVELGREPKKDAAGPNDFQHMLHTEKWARSQQFFEFTPRNSGNGYDFEKLNAYNRLLDDALMAVQPYRDKLEKILALFLPMKTQEAEILATVHAAWNNLLLDNAKITEEAIIHEARENWHSSKMNIPVELFHKAIRQIWSYGLIPDGKAKRVIGQEI